MHTRLTYIEFGGEQIPLVRFNQDRLELLQLSVVQTDTRRKVHFLGMAHRAQLEFYEQRMEFLYAHDGLILQEGIRSEGILNTKESAIVESLAKKDAVSNMISTYLDETSQSTGMPLDDFETLCDDMSIQEITAELEQRGLDFGELSMLVQEYEAQSLALEEFIKSMSRDHTLETAQEEDYFFLRYVFERTIANTEELLSPVHVRWGDLFRIFEEVIVDVRNRRMVEYMRRYIHETDIIVPWGALHLPGMYTELVSQGHWEIVPDSVQYTTMYKQNNEECEEEGFAERAQKLQAVERLTEFFKQRT